MHQPKRRIVAVLTSAALVSGTATGVAAACGDRGGDSGTYPTDTSGTYPGESTTTTTAGSTSAAATTKSAKAKKAKRKARRAASPRS